MIIITGAGGGIGSEVAQQLADQDQIIGLYHSRKPSFEKNIQLAQVDITDEQSVRDFVKSMPEAKHITIVHFAAVKIDGLTMTFDLANWKKVMDVNLNGNFLLTSALLPLMIKNNWGRIIHVSSAAVRKGVNGTAAYHASKTALQGWSSTLSREYGRFNITSNVLGLGYFEVGLINTLSDSEKNKAILEIPSGKLGKTSNIVNAIRFLIESEYVNNAYIDIHGGI